MSVALEGCWVLVLSEGERAGFYVFLLTLLMRGLDEGVVVSEYFNAEGRRMWYM